MYFAKLGRLSKFNKIFQKGNFTPYLLIICRPAIFHKFHNMITGWYFYIQLKIVYISIKFANVSE